MKDLNAAYPMLNAAGKVETVPLQVIPLVEGLMIRIGDNMLFWNKDGSFDGIECKVSADQVDELQTQLHNSSATENQAPKDSYYQEGSEGWLKEIAGWPREQN